MIVGAVVLGQNKEEEIPTRPVVAHQKTEAEQGAAGVGDKKPTAAAEAKNRRAFGDIGNLVNVTTADLTPVTRSFRAQLLEIEQEAAAANKKSTDVVDDGVKEKAKVARQKAAVKPKPESETVIKISPDTEEGGCNGETNSSTNQKNVCEKSSKIKVTYVLTAQRKVACGIKAIDDIDSAGAENQLAVVDYVEDIYKFYRLMETPSRVPDYMTTWANSLTPTIGCNQSLSNWLIEVHNKFELMPETLYLTVHIIDQFLSMRTVLRRELQSVVASKYEEIWGPEINDFLCITDIAYTREGTLRMEKSILNDLEWSLTVPTPYVFLVQFLKAAKSGQRDGRHGFLQRGIGLNAVFHEDNRLPINDCYFCS